MRARCTTRLGLLLSTGLFLLACGPGIDPADVRCRKVVCDSPPQADCLDGVLRSYQPPGNCEIETGLCSYASVDTSCEYGCFDLSRCRRPGDLLFSVATGSTLPGSGYRQGPLAADAEGRVYLLGGGIGWGAKPSIFVNDGGELSSLGQIEGVEMPGQLAPISLARGRPVVAATVANGCRVELFDLLGEPVWNHVVTTCILVGMPAVARDGSVFFAVRFASVATIYKWDAAGEQQWRTTIDGELTGGTAIPVIGEGGRVYLVLGQTLFALDEAGKQRWTLPGIGDTASAAERYMALLAGVSLFVPEEKRILAINVEDGSVRWTYELASATSKFRTPPQVDAQGRVYIGVRDEESARVLVLEAGGTLARTLPLGDVHPLLINLAADGSVVVASDVYDPLAASGDVRAFDGAGELLWQTSLAGSIGDLLIDPLGRIHVHLVDQGIWTLQGSAPLLGGGWPRARGGIHNGGCGPTGG